MSKREFLEFPKKECSLALYIGERAGGKSYICFNSVKYWIENQVFPLKNIHLVIPSFRDEQNDSYSWLRQYPEINIYDTYHGAIGKAIMKASRKNTEEHLKKKNVPLEKWLLVIDDSSHIGRGLFYDKNIQEIAVLSRHLRIHTNIVLHYDKACIPKKVKEMTDWIFIFNISKEILRELYRNFVNFEEFDNFNAFNEYWNTKIRRKGRHGALLIAKKLDCYNPYVKYWFKEDPNGKQSNEEPVNEPETEIKPETA